ncbi:hypothetical protein B0T10DRAFT_140882 [Thelonectria olida]|uniref:Uncharacterized protein n=1 Tax=Thelonectria olida TaxID=1576542 RepID=A0A9P9ANN3_9HYPO|nr:hypothetical protein B0T10DRAFT_140882 [Thelonectria olida]
MLIAFCFLKLTRREASEATAANTDGVKDILSRYEAYMAGQRERHGQGHLVPDDGDTSPPSQPNDRDSQPPVHDDSVAGRNPSDGQPQETLPSNKTLGGKRHGQAAAGRVRKKRASTRRGQEYEFLRLGGVRRQGRKTQYKVFWAPTWMTLADLRGQRAFEEAGDLVTKEFGRDEWEKEARAAGFREAFNMDSEIEYASE